MHLPPIRSGTSRTDRRQADVSPQSDSSVLPPVTTRTLAAEQARPLAARLDGGAIGAWTLGFATVAYLGLKGGGYDVVVRSQAGIGVWWIVLIGAALGVLPQRRVGRAGLAALGLLAAFAAWSALSALWSESPERTISETARVVTLLGVAVLALSTVRAQRVRPLVNGIFAAIVGVGVLACLSRLHPAWFGAARDGPVPGLWLAPVVRPELLERARGVHGDGRPARAGDRDGRADAGRALRGARARCRSLVLTELLHDLARRHRWPSASGSSSPSRSRPTAAAGSGSCAWSRRPPRSSSRAPCSARSCATAWAARSPATKATSCWSSCSSSSRGSSSCTSARVSPVPPSSRRRCRPCAPSSAAWPGAAVVVALVAGATVFAASGALADRWQEFKAPPTATASNDVHRLGTFTGESRYQVWVSAFDAFKSAPVAGIGAGSFDDWWQRHATTRESLRNAHSLYAETLGELGLVGITLLLALIALIIAAGMRGVRRTTGPPPALLAGATAACAAFAVAAGVDWLWQVTVLPVCFLLLGAAVLLAPRGQDRDRPPRRGDALALVAFAVVALVGARRPARRRDATALQPAGGRGQPARSRPAPGEHLAPRPALCLLAAAAARTGPGAARRPRRRGGRGAGGASARSPPTGARRSCSPESRPNAAT